MKFSIIIFNSIRTSGNKWRKKKECSKLFVSNAESYQRYLGKLDHWAEIVWKFLKCSFSILFYRTSSFHLSLSLSLSLSFTLSVSLSPKHFFFVKTLKSFEIFEKFLLFFIDYFDFAKCLSKKFFPFNLSFFCIKIIIKMFGHCLLKKKVFFFDQIFQQILAFCFQIEI